MIKMIIIGVSGLVVALGLTVGALMFLGKKETAVTAEKTEAVADSSKVAAEKQPTHETPATAHPANTQSVAKSSDTPHDTAMDTALSEQGLTENDLHAIDNIVANLQSIDVPLETPTADTTKKIPTPATTTAATTSTSTSTDTSAFASKEASLTKREKELDERQKTLEKREQEIARKMLVIDQAQSNRVATLAKLYDSMDPSQAAAVMQGIDDETIVMILPRMKTQNAAGVLAQLPPQRASLLSKKMISIVDEGL